jgi:uncharacterized protein
MRAVFLDTVGLLALWDVRDQWHEVADNAFSDLIQGNARLYTTELVFAECANAASRMSFRAAVAEMRMSMARAGALLVPADLEITAAWDSYHMAPAGSPGIVDLLSFSVMRRFNITEAFTNDRHFKIAGFVTLF